MLAAYQWLSENYMPGDNIFLFGKRRISLMLKFGLNYLFRFLSWSISSSGYRRDDRKGEALSNVHERNIS